jgi:hypothetical protein
VTFDAEAIRRAKLLERRTGLTPEKLPPKFEEFTPVFLAWSKQQHRKKTCALHTMNCEVLKRYFSGKRLDEITAAWSRTSRSRASVKSAGAIKTKLPSRTQP